MPAEGWIALPRSFLDGSHPDHPLSTGKPACKAFAWLDLVALARFESVDGLQRGQVYASVRYLANRWNWSRGKVQRWLDEKRRDFMIRGGTLSGTETGHPVEPITIIHYDDYTTPWKNSGTPTGHSAGRSRMNGSIMKSARAHEERQRPPMRVRSNNKPTAVQDILEEIRKQA